MCVRKATNKGVPDRSAELLMGGSKQLRCRKLGLMFLGSQIATMLEMDWPNQQGFVYLCQDIWICLDTSKQKSRTQVLNLSLGALC